MNFPFFALLAFMAATTLPVALSQDTQTASCRPDPHFRTFDATYYDYQGVCDLILLQNPFLNMLLHIRTADRMSYSSISKAALQIGSDVLEVRDNRTFAINGVENSTQRTIDGKTLTVSITTSCGTCDDQIDYTVALSGGQFVRIRNWYTSMDVDVSGHVSDFSSAVGMLGTWGTPGLIGRDGTTSFDRLLEGDLFASEWQVNSTLGDAVLFSDPSSDPCTPSLTRSACGTDNPDCGAQAEVCEGIATEGERDNCIFDVERTGDTIWAENPAYTEPVLPLKEICFDDKEQTCAKRGGKCVWRCDTDRFDCIEELCFNRTVIDIVTKPDDSIVEGCSCALRRSPSSSPSSSPSYSPSSSPSLSPSRSPSSSPSWSPSSSPSSSPSPRITFKCRFLWFVFRILFGIFGPFVVPFLCPIIRLFCPVEGTICG